MTAPRNTSKTTNRSQPAYELRTRRLAPGQELFEIWQVPSPATPQITAPVRVAGLHGRNLELFQHRVVRLVQTAGVRLTERSEQVHTVRVDEELALMLGLLFRTLAPMRNRDNMRQVVEGIEKMGREEAAYWLGMAVHRANPRRVLTALRVLLTEPSFRKETSI
ncbi:hypothetical protein KKC22_04290 [Myxococcota bacterium]|nr:hypothetical protein [Myxococcota bacterium]